MIVKEGKAEIEIDGVFYNPKMKFCRDLDMLVFSLIPSKTYLDALSASGVRGIRAHLEANKEVYLNDRSAKAVKVIERNVKRNNVRAKIFNKDANIVMREMFFDHVDIDPFGSPSQFIDSACFSAKKCISVTATDTAALCGSAVNSCLRKYSCFVEKTEFYPEVGLRVLAGKLACEATKYDKSLEFVICWAKEHYYRLHSVIHRSPKKAAKVYDNIGYLLYCKNCGWRKTVPIRKFECIENCELCGSKLSVYGTMWIGKLYDANLCLNLLKIADRKEILKMLKKICAEASIDVPFYYDIHVICRRFSLSPPPFEGILEKLKELGYKAVRSSFSGTGIKTDAGINVLRDVLMELNIEVGNKVE